MRALPGNFSEAIRTVDRVDARDPAQALDGVERVVECPDLVDAGVLGDAGRELAATCAHVDDGPGGQMVQDLCLLIGGGRHPAELAVFEASTGHGGCLFQWRPQIWELELFGG
ncbi:hypothetical protein [Streptomyces sp. NPDC059970]|uniref:hypothetical protein n=1 Tax=Streptomyces sp. NPDC059970 TaxID=3347019 RepID=UPI00368C59B1